MEALWLENMVHSNVKENLKRGEKVANQALWLESSIVVAKTVIGVLSGSTVLISDAIHSGSDIMSIFTSWLGLKISQKKPNERFSYGFYKAESLGTLLISAIILFAFYDMFRRGIELFGSYSEIRIPVFALAVSFLDALTLFFFGNYEIKVGKATNTQSLVAMGKENRTHIFSSGIVFIGILASYFKYPNVEAIFTLVISFLILKIGWEALRDSIFTLMDISPDTEISERVVSILEAIPGIEEYSDLRLRESGPSIFGEVRIGIRKSRDAKSIYRITNLIEEKVKKSVSQIEYFTVKVEPFESVYKHIAVPVERKGDLDVEISKKFARASYFLFVNIKNDSIVGYYFIDNPYKGDTSKVGLSASKLIAKQEVDDLIVSEIGEISFYTLRDNFIDLYKFNGDTANEAVRNYIKGNLSEITYPDEREQK
ncbi:cation diffusion facilitator family transporter [Patescibacteria group bacterium]|nr:cation diffusion facilitator family transporter [Patescibacteria group bacterium]